MSVKRGLSLMVAIFFFLYAFFIGSLLYTNRILLYLHPKMLPFAYFATGVFIILGVMQSYQWFKGKVEMSFSSGHILFAVPLFLVWALSPTSLSPELAQSKGVYVVAPQSVSTIEVSRPPVSEALLEGYEPIEIDYSGHEFQTKVMQYLFDPTPLIDQPIALKGFAADVYSDDEQVFLLGRLLITCCAADAQIAGFKCRIPEGVSISPYEWYDIEGVLRRVKEEDGSSFDPNVFYEIEVLSITQTDEPVSPYIYP